MYTGNLRLPPPRGFAEDQTVTVISITPQEPPNRPPQRRPLAAWAEEPPVDNSGGGGGRAAGGQLFGPGLNGGEKKGEEESERTDSGWRRSGNPRIATNGSLTG